MRTLLLLFFTSFICIIQAQEISKNISNDPSIIMHDTIADPGIMQLQIDALNFTGSNGDISAITFNIDIDTLLVEYISIQNMGLPGSWIGNYNTFQNEITISYVAPFGTGYDINGKLLDLEIEYSGGFSTELAFKPNCEISNVNLQTLTNVTYYNGLIEQTEPNILVKQDTIIGHLNNTCLMPLIAGGNDLDSLSHINLRIGYDTNQLTYSGILDGILSNISVIDDNQTLTFTWEDVLNPINLTSSDTLAFIEFIFIGDTNTITEFLPGSTIRNNGIIPPTAYSNGEVVPEFYILLLNEPDSAGTTLGSGYYNIGDPVQAIAIPEQGFHFENWTRSDTVVSNDSVYNFICANHNDTLTANYSPFSYNLDLLVVPALSGFVTGEGTYAYGESVTINASPALGFEFVGWFNDNQLVSTENEYTLVMPFNDIEYTAVFDTITFEISVEPNDITFGSTTGGGVYNYADTVTILAIPNTDYTFVAWTENGQIISHDAEYTFQAYSDRSIIGNFELTGSCMPPIGLFAGNISETEAELSWNPSGDELEWDLIWGENGFDTISGGTLVEGLDDTYYFLQNLDPGTYYDFYVRAVCSINVRSQWSVVHSFYTWYVGLPEKEHTNDYIIYPNPVTSVLNVTTISKINSSEFLIVDILRKVKIFGKINESHSEIDITNLPSGIYHLILFNSKGNESHSFVKQ